MHEFRWPIVITTALLALTLFFGINYYRQRYFKEEPFLNSLRQLESIEDASLFRENGKEILEIMPSNSYRGPLRDLVMEIEDLAADRYKKPLQITVRDRRNVVLETFARSVTPDLFEAAMLANYRSVADSVGDTADQYNLDNLLFSVDYDRLYLQARDGDYVLYLIIPLERAKGGA